MRLIRYAGGKAKTAFAAFGIVAAGGLYYEYRRTFPSYLLDDEDDDGGGSTNKKKRKQVLVIPFHRIDLKDKHRQTGFDVISRWDGRGGGAAAGGEDPKLRFEVRELVDLIHAAASDPEIVALYGTFGHGSLLPNAGWADLEEVRNALKVFRESHRVHSEPNTAHELHQVIQRTESKPMYAYADTFASIMDSGNKEYYLASIFTHVHMQEKGELNLFGMISQQLFLRGMLEKYGIVMHVFKHGQYKNFANMFTESGFNRPHRENVTNVLDDLNRDVCESITVTRSKALLASWLKSTSSKSQQQQQSRRIGADSSGEDALVWRRIHESGTFPASTAWKGGLVDFLPRRDPLLALVEHNKSKRNGKVTSSEGTEKGDGCSNPKEWKVHETDFDRFKADQVVTVASYHKKLKKKKIAEERQRKWSALLHRHPNLVSALSSIGVDLPFVDKETSPTKEKIALLYVQGAIDDKKARKTVNTIRKIREDKGTKCVVVRVASPGGSIQACETISEELKGLKIPVVFSFGNIAASGGYYIASMADRVFASHKTVTGSIGVFGLRADITGLAAQYGVTSHHIAAGDLSGSYNPLVPMTRKMKENFADTIDRYYMDFKNVVSTGRGLSLDDVEKIAQGRVWTGVQAKMNGLVDELGGLQRAIAYARRTHTAGVPAAVVVVWPKQQSLFELLAEAAEEGDVSAAARSIIEQALVALDFGSPASRENTGVLDSDASLIAQALSSSLSLPMNGRPLPGTLSGFFYTSDEDSAIRCLLSGVGE